MKANELMVGDWVNLNFDIDYKTGKLIYAPVQVTGINKDGTVDVNLTYDKSESMQDGWDLKLIEAILLTPEILEKNGFKYEEHHGFRISSDLLYVCIPKYDGEDYKEGLVPYTYITGGNSDYGDDGVYMYLNFVHELQHVLKLCGIEKEIVL